MSDNYIVSARKYRPQTFDTVVGQEHITTTLKNAIRNQHLAHAYLFCGPRGVGKTTCARILAKTINCESPTPDMEACGVCPTCTSFKSNTSFNVFELDAASNNSVEDIRELTNQVRFAPQQGRYKVYIIDEVHMLSSAAFNAFLKTLEEPPSYAIFILATTEKHKILPTILSRCQIFDFKRITTGDITGHLQSIATKEGMVAQEAALHIIAQKSEGCMRDALSMIDRIASFTNGMLTYSNTMEHLNLLDADFYFGLTDNMLSQDVAGTLLMLDRALEKGFEGDVIMTGMAEHFRNMLLCKDARMAKLLDVPNDLKQTYHEKANQAPPSFLLSALNVLNEAELNFKNATNKRLHVEMCLIRLCFLLQTVSAETLDVKKNLSSVGGLAEATAPLPVKQPQAAPASAPQPVNNQHIAPQQAMHSAVTPTIAAPAYMAPAPPPPMPAPPVQQAPQAMPAPASMPRPGSAPPPPTGRRLSMDMLAGIEHEVQKKAANQDTEQKILTQERAAELWDLYKQRLQGEGKSSYVAQFGMMRIEVRPPDELLIVSPTELTDTYAREQRMGLIDFYREQTKMIVRVRTEIQEDEAIKAEMLKNVVLSKGEMFEAMAQKNPNLARLKDSLNMHIEY